MKVPGVLSTLQVCINDGIITSVLLLFLLSLLLSFELPLFDRAAPLLPLPALLVVNLSLSVNARHREHPELAIVQQLRTTIVIQSQRK